MGHDELAQAQTLLDVFLAGDQAASPAQLTELRRLVGNARARQQVTLVGCRGPCKQGFRAHDLREDGWCVDSLTAALRSRGWTAHPGGWGNGQ